MELRLNKILSDSGYCSRREADTIIKEGRVTVNGRPAKIGMKVKETDIVEFDGAVLKMKGAFAKARKISSELPFINPKSADLRKMSKNNRLKKYKQLNPKDYNKASFSKPWQKKKKEK